MFDYSPSIPNPLTATIIKINKSPPFYKVLESTLPEKTGHPLIQRPVDNKSGCLQIKKESMASGLPMRHCGETAIEDEADRVCERPTCHEPVATRANGCHQSEIRPYM